MAISKKLREIMKVIYYMIRKQISKNKLAMDLNLLLKRGNRLATKTIHNFIFHHSSGGLSSVASREYEFSCSTTPNFSFSKHRYPLYHTNFIGCAFHTHESQEEDIEEVRKELDRNNNITPSEIASPFLSRSPRTLRSPSERQLTLTDSPFTSTEMEDDDNGHVDKMAEEFIARFYRELRNQRSE